MRRGVGVGAGVGGGIGAGRGRGRGRGGRKRKSQEPPGKDYYALLGVAKDAPVEEVKRAYRKAARRWHPDRNQGDKATAEEKFKELQEAYDILCDEGKRSLYDRYGEGAVKAQERAANAAASAAGPDTDGTWKPRSGVEEYISQVFGFGYKFGAGFAWGGAGGAGGSGGSGSHNGTNGDTSNGTTTGIPDGVSGSPTNGHSGMGGGVGVGGGSAGLFLRKAAPVEKEVLCSLEELYSGKLKKMKVTRTVENEDGSTTTEDNTLEIPIKPGWKEGTRITFAAAGDKRAGELPADIVFVIRQKPHERFVREGDDLIHVFSVSLTQALCPGVQEIDIATLDERMVPVPVPDVIHPGYMQVIDGEGMPNQKDPQRRGKLVVKFNVVFPQSLDLTQEQKEQLVDILGP